MIIKKDSLLFRIITYNGLAIIFVGSVMASLFSILIFNELNSRLLEKAREKIFILEKAYDLMVEESEDELSDAVKNATNSLSLTKGMFNTENRLADIIKNQLNIEAYEKYKNSYIQVLSPRKNIVGESGNREIRNDFIAEGKLIPSNRDLEEKTSYFVGTKENLYIRIITSYRLDDSFEERYVILTMPINSFNLASIKSLADLDKSDKIFVLLNNKYLYGDFDIKSANNFLNISRNNKSDKIFSGNKYYFSEKKLKGTQFYIVLTSLTGEDFKNIGSIGVAISKTNFLALKYMLATIILVICLLSVIISTTLCARIFTKLLYPLSLLADKTKEIGDNSEINFEEEKVYEIRSISNSLKTLNRRIKVNEDLLLKKNENLNSNLNRIIAVESVLMGVDLDKNFSESIIRILEALTSEVGFGYSRAIYLEYDEEINSLTAKQISINPHITANIEKYTGGMKGFRFQIKDLENMLSLLKVKYETGNLFWESINSQKIIFFNEKGYKYNFGNELFKSLGITNFMILPISDKDLRKGCILIDYFGKEKSILNEEVEVMKLLLMNIIIRVKNHSFEEKKLSRERILTIGQISNRFLDNNNNLLNKIESLVEKISSNGYNNRDTINLMKFLREEKKQIKLMKRLINDTERKFRSINLEKIVEKALKDIKPDIIKYGIDLSLFFNYSGNIFGDRRKIYQMIIEILKNSINAIMIRNKLDKKINILINNVDNNRIALEIIDNGIGMKQEEIEQLEKPYSEREKNKIGLGMTTICNTVKEHKALIKIISKMDEGTKIRIIFNEYREEKENER